MRLWTGLMVASGTTWILFLVNLVMRGIGIYVGAPEWGEPLVALKTFGVIYGATLVYTVLYYGVWTRTPARAA